MSNITLKEGLKELSNNNFTHVLEFGVHKGKTIQYLRNSLPEKYQIFGFDSFVGLPEDWEGTNHKKGSMSTNGVVPNIHGVKFYKGWFEDTIPEYLQIADKIGLLHIDCDLYSSTKTVLNKLNTYIVDGTVIVFDEWFFNHNDIPENRTGEQKAFYEWAKEYKREFILLTPLEEERQIVIIKK